MAWKKKTHARYLLKKFKVHAGFPPYNNLSREQHKNDGWDYTAQLNLIKSYHASVSNNEDMDGAENIENWPENLHNPFHRDPIVVKLFVKTFKSLL
jgi:hypothetical protein